VGDPHNAILGKQRRGAVVVAHHPRVSELATQRLDLDPIRNGLKVSHPSPPLSVLQSLQDQENARAPPVMHDSAAG
jgi:hypothetical protein